MRQLKPLHAGDTVRLIAPGCGEPTGDCLVIADQDGALVWFRSSELPNLYRDPYFVARRSAVKVIQRRKIRPDGVRSHPARTSHNVACKGGTS